MTETSLTFRSGHWSNDDYDVYDGDRVIGARGRTPSLSDRGYAASREQAMAKFKAQWDSPTALA
jgi:hypothetical protein